MATVNKILVDGVGIDLTSDTVSEAVLLEGYTAHNAKGAIITGTCAPSSGNYVEATATVASRTSADFVIANIPEIVEHYNETNLTVEILMPDNTTLTYMSFAINSNAVIMGSSTSYGNGYGLIGVRGNSNSNATMYVNTTSLTTESTSARHLYVTNTGDIHLRYNYVGAGTYTIKVTW